MGNLQQRCRGGGVEERRNMKLELLEHTGKYSSLRTTALNHSASTHVKTEITGKADRSILLICTYHSTASGIRQRPADRRKLKPENHATVAA